jgi:hypothetical protein
MTKDQKIAELERRIKELEDSGRYWPGYVPPMPFYPIPGPTVGPQPVWYTPSWSPDMPKYYTGDPPGGYFPTTWCTAGASV